MVGSWSSTDYHCSRFTERAATDYGVAAVRQWAAREGTGPRGALGPEVGDPLAGEWLISAQDIFISADVDEVLGRDALHQLRWCQAASDVFTGLLLLS